MSIASWISTPHVTISGIPVAIDQKVMSSHMLEILSNGSYEQAEAAQIPQIVQDGDRVVELGGGTGFISALVAKQNKASKITVYEANPELIGIIKRTHALNNVSVDTVNAVVLPQPASEHVPFYIRGDFWASSLSPEPYGYDRVVDVPAVDFNEMINRLAPTMLIVDIEGGERFLFENVSLEGVKKVYIELHQDILGRVGIKRIFDFFSSRDFHYDVWHSNGGVVLFSHVLR